MVDRALTEWGSVDILVNNAWGGGALGRLEYKNESRFDKGFHVGFYGPLWAMQAAFPSMRDKGFGRIISMCSLNGVNAHVGTAEYNSAKEALRALTRTAARGVGAVRHHRQRDLPGREDRGIAPGLRAESRARGDGGRGESDGPAR